MGNPLREFENSLLIRNVIASHRRGAQGDEQEAVLDFLKKSKLVDVITGMAAEAKKDGVRFGMRDAKEAMHAWYLEGGKEIDTPAQTAARRYISSDKGKKLMTQITKGLAEVLKKAKGKAGLRDVGEAIVDFLS